MVRLMTRYPTPIGGLPGQSRLMTGRASFTTAYAVIPRSTNRDITASYLPHWTGMRMWVIARPMTGFAETFSHYMTEVSAGGGSTRPENDPHAQSILFMSAGQMRVTIGGESHDLAAGHYVYLSPGAEWTVHNPHDEPAHFHWIRKRYRAEDGIAVPKSFVTHEKQATVVVMPGTDGSWSTTRFVDPADMRHDMHVNIVNFEPGAHIPFMETHVMEHGLYVLEGRGVYRLNTDWVEVEAGDFMWLRAFCPQACYAGGPERFRYLLYKDVNRHMPLTL